jgi:hypothetical protein
VPTDPVGRVAALARFPVKSLLGERPARLHLDRRGVVGDRLWCVRDADGKLGSGKSTRLFRRMPGLLELAAAYDGEVPVLRFPDGRTVRGDDPAVHGFLTAYVGRPVTLVREEAVSHFDEGPVHLVTTASLAAAAEPPVDGRRTRANLVVDTGLPRAARGGPPGEADWPGRRLRVGATAELLVTAPMPRCAMLGMAQDGLPQDRELLAAVIARSDGELGLVADVLVGGQVALGDEVRLL